MCRAWNVAEDMPYSSGSSCNGRSALAPVLALLVRVDQQSSDGVSDRLPSCFFIKHERRRRIDLRAHPEVIRRMPQIDSRHS
jgi:hypothetical protein